MSENEHTYERIIAYLKGLLSNRQRHDLERKMMQDAFDEEAFEGLNRLSAGSLETDMDVLSRRLHDRIKPAKIRRLTPVFRWAAAVVILTGLTAILLFIFRTPSPKLITQEISRQKQTAPAEVAAPEAQEPVAGVMKEPRLVKKTRDLQASKSQSQDVDEIMAESASMAAERESATESALIRSLPATRQKAADKMPADTSYHRAGKQFITGKVIGVDGESLPGVTIFEKGTSQGTVTDIYGNFSLLLSDSAAKLSLAFVGYNPLEINARDVKGKDITMKEDLMALEAVVVMGYATQKKSNETGAVSRLETRDFSSGEVSEYNFIHPVPPGGTLKAFKSWVQERVDSSRFRAFPGNYRMLFIFTVQTDGFIRDIKIRSSAPAPFAEEYKQVITQSPQWMPARKNEIPVESEVMIRFVVTVE